jgi:hypothetical protein
MAKPPKAPHGIFCPACKSGDRKVAESRKQIDRVRRRCVCLNCGEHYTTSETIIDKLDYLLFLEKMRTEGNCINLDLSAETKTAKITLEFPLPKGQDLPAFVEAVTRRWVVDTDFEEEPCDEEDDMEGDDE